MSSWTPGEWGTFFVAAGGFVTVISVQVANMIISIRNGRKADTNSALITENTAITKVTASAVGAAPLVPPEKP
jgi:hypothetical protein